MPQPLRRPALLAALTLVLASPSASAAPWVTNLTVVVGGYELFGALGRPPEPGAQVVVVAELWAPDGERRAETRTGVAPGGGFELAFVTPGLAPRRPILIHSGDTVRLLGPDAAETALTVPALTASADPEGDQVAGSAPPGSRLMVTAQAQDGRYASRSIVADGAGSWSVKFAGDVDLAAGSHGVAVFADGAGVSWQTEWSLLGLEARIGAPNVQVFTQPGATVRADLLPPPDASGRGQGVTTAWDHTATAQLRDDAGALTPVVAGMAMRLTTDAGPPTSWPVPWIDVRIDSAAGTVSGTAEAGSRFELVLPRRRIPVTANIEGNWSVHLAPNELTPDTPVEVRFPDHPYVTGTAYEPRVTSLDPTVAIIEGQGMAATPVRLLVRRQGKYLGRAAGWVGADGRFRLVSRAPNGQPLPRMAGDSWHVDYGGQANALSVTPFGAAADGGRAEVWGIAGAGQDVRVGAAGVLTSTVAAADGAWRVRLPLAPPLPPGTPIEVSASTDGGPVTQLTLPVFRASVQTNGDRLRVEGHPGLAAQASVARAGTVVATGDCQIDHDATGCELSLTGPDWRHLTPAPGDTVRVTPTVGTAAVIEVAPLAAHIDLGGHSVVGLAPPRNPVQIAFSHGAGRPTPLDASTRSFGSGVFDYELSATEWPVVTRGLVADVFVDTPNGHRLFARAVLEGIAAGVGAAGAGEEVIGGGVRAWAEPGATVTLERARAGTPTRTVSAIADARGYANLRFVDPGDWPSPNQPGDVLTVRHGRGAHQVIVVSLTGWLTGPAGAAIALTAPGTAVRVWHNAVAGLDTGDIQIEAVADNDGITQLDAPALSPADWLGAWLTAILPDGDVLMGPAALAPGPVGRVLLPSLGRAAP